MLTLIIEAKSLIRVCLQRKYILYWSSGFNCATCIYFVKVKCHRQRKRQTERERERERAEK